MPKQKASDATPTAVPSLPMTLVAEAPQLILPFTTSITLRRDATASPTSPGHDASASTDEAVRVTIAPAESAAAPLENTVPADTSISVLPVTSASTFEQVVSVVQNSSTLSEPPNTVSASTSDLTIAYQYRAAKGRPTETAFSLHASEEPKDISDPAQAVTPSIPVPNPVPLLPIHPVATESKPTNSGPADYAAAAGTELKNAAPALESAGDTTAAINAGPMAFAARLTSTVELQPPGSESERPIEPLPGSITPLQFATPLPARQIAPVADLPADAPGDDSKGRQDKDKPANIFVKPETLLPQIHAAVADRTVPPANSHAATSLLPPTAHFDRVNLPADSPNTSRDITVRIPDATGPGTSVRFVERAGEIHVSVRTSDMEMAQSLRGGLSDLVNHLEDGGIRTEVWQPGDSSNAAFSQNDSHHPFADPDGSNGRQYPSGSNSEQGTRQQNRPRWMEELEGSIGNSNLKETKQQWQA